MRSISCMPISSSSHTFLKHNPYPLLGDVSSKPCLPLKRRANFTTRALLSSTKESVLREFHERRALKVTHTHFKFLSLSLCPVPRKNNCLIITNYSNESEDSAFGIRLPVPRKNTHFNFLSAFQANPANAVGHAVHMIISGLQNFNKDNIASVVTAADKGGATHVDIACDPELVKLAISLTSCPVCVSSIDPATFPAAVEAGALMVEIGNYDSFYEKGMIFTPEQILGLTKETRRLLPSIVLSVTVPHTLSLLDQVKLAESLEQEGADIIQTEGGKCSNPTKSGVLGLIEKATPTLAAAYSISRSVKIPVLCSSGLSAVTAPMAITAGAAGVGVGSAVNKLNDVVAMIAEVRGIADSLQAPFQRRTAPEEETQRL